MTATLISRKFQKTDWCFHCTSNFWKMDSNHAVSTSWSAVFRDSVVPSHEASLISVRDSKNYHLILGGGKIGGDIA